MSWRFCSQRCWSRWARRPGANSTWRLAGGACPGRRARAGQDGADGQQPVLDANGRPYVAQPPQPRIDGTLGVPDKPADREWAINTVSLFDSVSDPNVKLSRERISADQAREIAAASQQVPLPTGTSDVSTLDLQAPGTSTAVNGGAQDRSRPAATAPAR